MDNQSFFATQQMSQSGFKCRLVISLLLEEVLDQGIHGFTNFVLQIVDAEIPLT